MGTMGAVGRSPWLASAPKFPSSAGSDRYGLFKRGCIGRSALGGKRPGIPIDWSACGLKRNGDPKLRGTPPGSPMGISGRGKLGGGSFF